MTPSPSANGDRTVIEIDDVWKRITALIESVDDGKMPLF